MLSRRRIMEPVLTPYNRRGLRGERSLIAAVMALSLDDARKVNGKHVDDARAYFADGRYDFHLDLLGLPDNWLPKVLEGEHV